MSDLSKKKYYKNLSKWQDTCNLITNVLYIERTYEEISELVGLSADRVRHILYKMLKENKVRRIEKENKAAYIRTLER